jgi:hypothetical protein
MGGVFLSADYSTYDEAIYAHHWIISSFLWAQCTKRIQIILRRPLNFAL